MRCLQLADNKPHTATDCHLMEFVYPLSFMKYRKCSKISFVEESECYIWKRKSEEIFHSRHVHIINMRIGNAVNCRGTPAGLGRHAWCN
ncbi:hypothetical protein T07_14402 [Trichinella nelsoni]|uniref:Uncharacterized protein n=1 Tax=Trichinella nelsoni TaxID=6336 RepID=A0A0V0S1K0_9BILA|nr:hypothetical protein T07_14402 [Trichinella nelsoni]